MQKKKLDQSKIKAVKTTKNNNKVYDRANFCSDIGIDLKTKDWAKCLKLKKSFN